MRVLEVTQDKTTSTMQQGIGTNYKNLQVHENKPKSLQKQHGYKTQKLCKHGYKNKHFPFQFAHFFSCDALKHIYL